MSISNNTEIQIFNNSFEWIEEAISKKHIKYYDYKDFYNIEKIDNKKIDDYNFGKVYRTNLKNSEQYFALKSFNFDNAVIVKEIIHEIKLHRKINFHNNIIQIFGLTGKENRNEIIHRNLHSNNIPLQIIQVFTLNAGMVNQTIGQL
ncbi:unnamed protein product [Rhizophagus irregularis]|nr:unnamed protein product [Rhizophagus irregularis]